MALYGLVFSQGRPLNDPAVVFEAAAACGLEEEAVAEGVEQQGVKDELRASTAAGDRAWGERHPDGGRRRPPLLGR